MYLTIVQDKMWYMISPTCNSQILSQERTFVESFEEILFHCSSPTLLMNLPSFISQFSTITKALPIRGELPPFRITIIVQLLYPCKGLLHVPCF